MELTSFEESTELLDVEAVGGHVGVLSVPVFFPRLGAPRGQNLQREDPLDANLLGQLGPMHQGFIFGDVV
jgi:hypothetical protein